MDVTQNRLAFGLIGCQHLQLWKEFQASGNVRFGKLHGEIIGFVILFIYLFIILLYVFIIMDINSVSNAIYLNEKKRDAV